jgi:hypothetical protein
MGLFWQAFVRLMDTLYEQYRIDKIKLDVTRGDWEDINHKVVDFLSLSWSPDPVIPQAEANRFTGTYQFQDDGRECNIHYENGSLITDAFMNTKTKLIPQSQLTFLAEAWHFEIVLEQTDAGRIASFFISGKDIDYLRAVGRKAKRQTHENDQTT